MENNQENLISVDANAVVAIYKHRMGLRLAQIAELEYDLAIAQAQIAEMTKANQSDKDEHTSA